MDLIELMASVLWLFNFLASNRLPYWCDPKGYNQSQPDEKVKHNIKKIEQSLVWLKSSRIRFKLRPRRRQAEQLLGVDSFRRNCRKRDPRNLSVENAQFVVHQREDSRGSSQRWLLLQIRHLSSTWKGESCSEDGLPLSEISLRLRFLILKSES